MTSTDQPPTLAIVVPCFNEEAALPTTAPALLKTLSLCQQKKKISQLSAIYFVDDGSVDNTWQTIEELASQNENVSGIKLARNVGHQNALLAGIFSVKEDVVVTIDADLQDDPFAIEKMLDRHAEGSEIVYGVRRFRNKDTKFKRGSAWAFYKLISLMGARIVENHADFRLMSRFAIECLREYGEANMFLRGIIPLIGLETARVLYDRDERAFGETKYPLRKMLGFAWEGVTSFTVTPLRAISLLGSLLAMLSLLGLFWVLWIRLFTDLAVPGWASVLLPLLGLSAVQLLSLGVVGEYIGKIYKETKRRPRYVVERSV